MPQYVLIDTHMDKKWEFLRGCHCYDCAHIRIFLRFSVRERTEKLHAYTHIFGFGVSAYIRRKSPCFHFEYSHIYAQWRDLEFPLTYTENNTRLLRLCAYTGAQLLDLDSTYVRRKNRATIKIVPKYEQRRDLEFPRTYAEKKSRYY